MKQNNEYKNNNEEQIRVPENYDNGTLWALLLTIGMIVVMALVKHYTGWQ